MRRIFVLLVALPLVGCAGMPSFDALKTAVTIGTTTIANPVTETRLNQMESTLTLVFAGLRSWKAACARGALPITCRKQIANVQVYTRQIPPYLEKLRTFVRDNDQVNAMTVFNTLSDIVTTVRTQSTAAGNPIGGES